MLYRCKNELENIADKFFKDIGSLFFEGYEMCEKRKSKGSYLELYLNGEKCGYAIALNSADSIKKISHLFSDVQRILFDEFQSETNNYVPNEVNKFLSVVTSISRGQGEQVRYVPVFLIGNLVSVINPYYVDLGVSNRLQSDTKFLRGKGWVLEQGFNESASVAQKEKGIGKAFIKNAYVEYSANKAYLKDNNNLIVPALTGNNKYLATLKYNNKEYAIREYTEQGLLYVDYSVDYTYPHRIVVSSDDLDFNYIMLKQNDFFIANMRYFFMHSCFRFKDASCQDVIIKLLSIK